MDFEQEKNGAAFRVHFDGFGTGRSAQFLTAQVVRVTRPGVTVSNVMGVDENCPTSVLLDLCDGVSDRVRGEVLTQLAKQMNDDAQFALVIETLDEARVIEQWRLAACRITSCLMDELSVACDPLLIHLVIDSARVSTTVFGEMLDLFG